MKRVKSTQESDYGIIGASHVLEHVPPTPVGQGSRKVMAIGRREQGRGQRWDGIECGALVMSTEIFDTLSILSRRRRDFTLADALDIFAGQGLLSSVTTEGKPWLALESKVW